jgi:predicted P-loop ATPase
VAGNLITFPGPDADTHARAETERKQKLFAWAAAVLQQLGLADKVAQAKTFDALRKIAFDVDDVDVELTIRDALHPSGGQRAEHFAGMRTGTLKRLLKMRFAEMKKDREKELRRPGAADGESPNWTADIKFDAKGVVRPILANLILFLRQHAAWKGVLAFDEFNNRVVMRQRPPWGEEIADTAWTDHHESLVRVWFQNEDIAANQGDVGRAVQAAARSKSFHPVRDYFDALAWDDTPRLDTWVSVYLHADDSEYARAIAPRFLISAVARIYQPGAKVDHMLVLEGPQGKQKSEALRTLAIKDAWFTDRLSHVGSKDANLETAGVLLIEIAEMDALTRASPSAMKRFLTHRQDRFCPPYGKHPVSLPRQCVFAGSINPVVGGYLKDPTGARRFWPVTCHGVIDRTGLERDRDQLWAEAIMRFRAGAKWWLETPELEALATVEQAARMRTDTWKEPIVKWLGKRKDTSVADVLKHALRLAPREQSRSAQMRVANILTDLGFTKHRPNKGGARQNRYWRK